MATNKAIYKIERIIPIKFERSTNAVAAGVYAPDIDDRGYTHYHGPVVGTCRSDKVQVDVIREQIDNNTVLYATSADTSKVTISPSSRELKKGNRAKLQFTAGATDGEYKIEIRAQALDGPVIAELTVLISEIMSIDCAVHRTAIYAPPANRGAANTTTRTMAGINDLMAEVNKQWRPMGVQFNVTHRKDDTNLTNQVARNGVNPTNGTLLTPVFGSGIANENFTRLMATNKVNNRLNIYFVRSIQAANPGGGAGPNYVGFGSAHHKGLVVSDNIGDLETEAHTVSHELGHILTLAAMGHTNQYDAHSDDDPQWDATIANRRHDLWSRRRLMYYMVGLQAAERTGAGGRYDFDGIDVGYGNGRSGHMLTIKNLANDSTDNEYTDARNQARTF